MSDEVAVSHIERQKFALMYNQYDYRGGEIDEVFIVGTEKVES